MPIAISAGGDVPGTILENSRPTDWIGTLRLSTPEIPTEVELTGASARLFEATVDHFSGAITILPAMVFDREAYPAGADPVFSFALRVKLASGWQEVAGGWSVTLQGLDDAPPSRVFFAAGGSVLESDIGAVIGRIQGGDPDTATSRLSYAVAGQDDWFFEIVDGNILKLREGVDLLRHGGTVVQVMIEVSDGRREASFLLDVQVLNTTDLDTAPAPPPVIVPQDPGDTGGDTGSDPDGDAGGTTDPVEEGTDPATGGDGTGGGTGPVDPAPPPVPDWQIEARLGLAWSGELAVMWRAEQVTAGSQPVVFGGTEHWQAPSLVLRILATEWSAQQAATTPDLDVAKAVAALSAQFGHGPAIEHGSGAGSLMTLLQQVQQQETAAAAALDEQHILPLVASMQPHQALSGEHYELVLDWVGVAPLATGRNALMQFGLGAEWGTGGTDAEFAEALFMASHAGAADPDTLAQWTALLASHAFDREDLAEWAAHQPAAEPVLLGW
ncbi:hypothetical protein [Teichococcus vastitatis]|uniref:Cadherin repeat domain-containing protein n=1 Tax=Teichococcus vastitatis TaxID=2307076 RepID=A0ABS9W3Y6_9PROT|nr:hypothetical protein [Pseudoroseomonas vastitatis]MCI0753980.1 hypothetical protein [Pseudoroseomonas vastitatis]